jgi:hypothetical protein
LAASSEYENKNSVCIKGGEFPEHICNYQFLKNEIDEGYGAVCSYNSSCSGDLETEYPELIMLFLSSSRQFAVTVLRIMPRTLPATSFTIHYLVMNLHYGS